MEAVSYGSLHENWFILLYIKYTQIFCGVKVLCKWFHWVDFKFYLLLEAENVLSFFSDDVVLSLKYASINYLW